MKTANPSLTMADRFESKTKGFVCVAKGLLKTANRFPSMANRSAVFLSAVSSVTKGFRGVVEGLSASRNPSGAPRRGIPSLGSPSGTLIRGRSKPPNPFAAL